MIKAPYNFVPLNDKIYFPDWAEKISHDIPFSDGESGVIKIKITAKSPVYVRNGSLKKDDVDFSNYGGKYFIPGTSIKGAIRNVLEIMSFSKMQFVDDRTYTWRDLTPGQDYVKNFVLSPNEEPLVKAGFIVEENDKWYLIPCDFARIEQVDIDRKIGVKYLSAKEKYDYWEKVLNKNLINNFNITKKSTKEFIKQCGKFARARFGGNIKGQLVFTGQISARNDGEEGEHGKGKKHLEFVFFNEKKSKIEIDENMRRNFELNHSNDRNKDKHKGSLAPNEEWGFWKKRLQKGEKMPVFWLEQNSKVRAFGLAMLFRLPLNYGIYDLIERTNYEHIKFKKNGIIKEKEFRPDMADSIFGYIVGKKALKGRVQFSHAFLSEEKERLNIKKEILSSPKPTFYPTYLKNGNYNDQTSILSGWKRYPVHKNIKTYDYSHIDTERVFTKFRPLPKESEFICKIRFHNLRKIELGALLTAITLYDQEKAYHTIGMAKPLGYGKVKIEIEDIVSDKLSLNKIREYEDYFISEINKELKIDWKTSKQIIEFFAMTFENKTYDNNLTYMVLNPRKKINQFEDAKKKKQKLTYYSKLNKIVELKSENEKLQEIKENIIDQIRTTKNYHDLFREWQDNEMLKFDKDIAKAFRPFIKKKDKKGNITEEYKIIRDILELSNGNKNIKINNSPIPRKIGNRNVIYVIELIEKIISENSYDNKDFLNSAIEKCFKLLKKDTKNKIAKSSKKELLLKKLKEMGDLLKKNE